MAATGIPLNPEVEFVSNLPGDRYGSRQSLQDSETRLLDLLRQAEKDDLD